MGSSYYETCFQYIGGICQNVVEHSLRNRRRVESGTVTSKKSTQFYCNMNQIKLITLRIG